MITSNEVLNAMLRWKPEDLEILRHVEDYLRMERMQRRWEESHENMMRGWQKGRTVYGTEARECVTTRGNS